MNRLIIRFLTLPVFVLLILFASAGLGPIYAQGKAESSDGQVAGVSGDASNISVATLEEGVRKGAYWWQTPDPNAVAGFIDFGVDTVVFRLGRVKTGITTSEAGESVIVPEWDDPIDFSVLSSLPDSLEYRPVLVIDRNVLTRVTLEDFANWFSTDVMDKLDGLPVNAIEIKLEDNEIQDYSAVGLFFADISREAGDVKVFAGVSGTAVDSQFSLLMDSVDGFVVYFTDYDYTGQIPRITDNVWISSTCSVLQNLGAKFIVVLPIYNQAVYRAAGSDEWIRLPAVDIEKISGSSDVTNMGPAGTEFVLKKQLNVGSFDLGVGDKIRVLYSTDEIDIRELTESLPALAPGIQEIDLFRFPLVPGFDPPSQIAAEKAGWIASRTVTGAMTAEDAVKKEMDQKHNQTQQIIMIVTVGMMMVVLMRMFSKGAGKQTEGSGEKK